MSLIRAVVSVASIFLGLSAAVAQQPENKALSAPAATTACNANTRGSVTCPNYTAPAATAVPSASMDGSMNIPASTSTTLFNGTVPPNAFMVQTLNGSNCFVNDHGLASGGGSQAGFGLLEVSGGSQYIWSFSTPAGYKPMGAVSFWCDHSTYVAARGW
jgi:hypothetical protein